MAQVFVAGVGMTRFGLRGSPVADLAHEAARAAMADAGVGPAGVRAVFASCRDDAPTPGGDAMRLVLRRCGLGRGERPAEYACASGARALYLAWRAVESELYDLVLCVGAGRSAGVASTLSSAAAPRRVEAARRYMAASGATVEHLARTVAKNRRHGGLNPAAAGAALAVRGDGDIVAAPLTRAMLAARSAGAAAVVLSSRRRFARLPRVRASVLAFGGRRCGAAAAALLYHAAGLGPDEIDFAEVHDDTAASELAAYETLHLIPSGYGRDLIESGFTELGGVLPVNTSGGLLSLGEVAGASGIAQVCELAWQLRGRAGARQVPRARVGLAHSVEEAGHGAADAVGLMLLTGSRSRRTRCARHKPALIGACARRRRMARCARAREDRARAMSAALFTDVSTLPELLRVRAAELGDETFLRDKRVTWSYGELARRVAEVAGGLRGLGVRRGDVVAIVLPNGPEYIEAWWAVLWLGAVFNPVNPALRAREACAVLADSGASVVICEPQVADALEERRGELPALRRVVRVDRAAADPLAALRGHPVAEPEPLGADDLCSLMYTSGTTGRPKGAMLTHGNFIANIRMLGELVPVGRGDTMGMVLPLFHVNAQMVTTMMPMLLGAQVAMWERFSASTFWDDVARFEPVTFSSVPTMLAALLHAPGADEAETNTLRFVICGAAPLSPALFRRFEEKFGVTILEGYGLTEGTCTSTLNPFYGPRKIGSIGLPVRHQEVTIRDEAGTEAPAGVVGEICVRGPNVMRGYLNRPEATAEALRDGWLHTGDVGYRDEDGYVFIVDRKKDMIIRGGENIYPREIEDVLLEHPGVQAAAVVGRPDEVRGEEVHAVVVLAPGTGIGELEEHCRERLAAFKVPSTWEAVDELPKTPTGKIDKKQLRARLVSA